MGREFRLAGEICRAIDAKGNAVTTGSGWIRRANQADSRISQPLEPVCFKMGGEWRRYGGKRRFSQPEASLSQ